MRLRSAAIAIVTVLGIVLGHVSAWAHDGAVRHIVCAQHGELVDAPELARAVGTGSWLVGVSGDGRDEHCAIANGMRHDVASAAAQRSLSIPLPPIATITADLAPRRATSLDFRIAPKTSPPARLR